MSDDLDDILSSALDEVALDDDSNEQGQDRTKGLSAAVKAAAQESASTAKKAESEASKAAMSQDSMEDQMASLLKELNDPEFSKTFEDTLKMLGQADGNGELPEGLLGEGEEDFAATLKALASAANGMEGGDTAAAEDAGERIMQEMMKTFEQMGNKDDFQSVMDNMMKQLLSKDVMYEPLKQISEKFPEWLADNEDKLEKEEYERYGKQYTYFQKIVATYETEPDNFARLSELFQEMQDCGQPPAEIMKELAPGLEMGPDGMPKFPGMAPGAPPPMPPGMDPNQCAQQ